MENQNIITNGKKLTARIREVTGSLNNQYANMQILLASAIWHGYGHGSNGYADTLVRSVPARMQGPVKQYLLELGPFTWDSKAQAMRTKKGTNPSIEVADEKTANLPDWQSFKKARTEKAYKASTQIASLARKIKQELAAGTMDAADVAAAEAFLSYVDNIGAGLTKEKMLADTQIAMQANKDAIARDAAIKTDQVIETAKTAIAA